MDKESGLKIAMQSQFCDLATAIYPTQRGFLQLSHSRYLIYSAVIQDY
jgi:hypothetical protein